MSTYRALLILGPGSLLTREEVVTEVRKRELSQSIKIEIVRVGDKVAPSELAHTTKKILPNYDLYVGVRGKRFRHRQKLLQSETVALIGRRETNYSVPPRSLRRNPSRSAAEVLVDLILKKLEIV